MIKNKVISISISLLMLLTLLPAASKHSVLKPMDAKAASNEEIIYSFLRNDMGFNVAVSCGILANIYEESKFNPNLYGDGGTSYGICQWHNSRMNNLINYCNNNGYDYRSLTGQLFFMKYELIYVPQDNGNIYNVLQN